MDLHRKPLDIEHSFVYYKKHTGIPQLPRKKKEREKMNLNELAREYNEQYKILCAKMDGLRPLLSVYGGEDLYRLRRKIRAYYDMACECRHIASLLSGYYEEDAE